MIAKVDHWLWAPTILGLGLGVFTFPNVELWYWLALHWFSLQYCAIRYVTTAPTTGTDE